MSDGVLYVEVMPSTKGIGRGITKDLDESLDGSEKKSKGLFGNFAKWGTLAVAGVATAVGALALKGGISRALNIEDAQAKLKGLGHDTKAVEAIMTDALAAVKGTAFGLDTAATVAATAVAAGIKPGQELEKYLRLTADAATIAGISMEEMGSILNKTTTAGKVYTQELNQLADRGLPVFQWLQDEYGVTAEELRKMVAAGEVDSATFRKVIEENIGGAALASGETTRGAFKNMMAAFSRLGAVFVTPILGPLKEVFGNITSNIDGLTSKLAPLGAAIGGAFSLIVSGDFTESIREATGWAEDSPIVDFLLRFHDGVSGLMSLLGSGEFTSALTSAFGWEEDSSIVDFILNIRDAITNFDFGALIAGAFEGRTNMVEAGIKIVQSLLEGLISAIPMIVQGASQMVTRILQLIVDNAPAIVTAALELFSGLLTALIEIIPSLIESIVALVPQIAATLIEMIPVLIEGAVSFLMAIVEAIPVIIPMLVAAITDLLPVILETLISLIPVLIDGALQLFLAIVLALPEIIPQLIVAIIDLMPVILDTLIDLIPALIDGAVQLFTGLIEAIPIVLPKLLEAVIGLGPKIVEAIIGIVPKLFEAGKALIQGLIDGVFAMFGAVGDAFGGMMDWIGGFFPNSPAKWGPFSGSGWTRLGKSGTAVIDEFMSGMNAGLPSIQARLDHSLSIPSSMTGVAFDGGIRPGDRVVFEVEGQPLTAVAKRVVRDSVPSAGAVFSQFAH
ncbi:MAG: tape measure protein [Microbacteriaceae bacterium]